MTEDTSQKNAEIQNEPEQKELLKPLHDTTMTKLKEAIELNKKSRKKDAWEAKEEACALLLVALRAGVQFDLNDPIFQVFVQKQSWQRAMGRACKDVCDLSTRIASSVQEIINLIPSIPIITPAGCIDFSIGGFLEKVCGFFKKDSKTVREKEEAYNHDIWDDFYAEIPKDGGNGPSLGHRNYNESPSEFQNLLSQKAADGKRRNTTINPSVIRKYLSEQAVVGNKAPNITPKNSSKGLLFSKDWGANNAA